MENKFFRIVHFSDSHEPACLTTPRALFDKRIIGFLNSRICRARQYRQETLRAAIDRILTEHPDFVIFTGDATSTGSKLEFERALTSFRPLLKSDIPFAYVPGNHDVYVRDKECRQALKQFYREMWRGTREYDRLPFGMTLGGLRFVFIDSAISTGIMQSNGLLSGQSENFLMNECSGNNEYPVVCVGHFPLLGNSSLLARRHGLHNAEIAAELLSCGKICLSLCGHEHTPKITLDENGFGEIVAGSVTRNAVMTDIRYDSERKRFDCSRVFLTKNSKI